MESLKAQGKLTGVEWVKKEFDEAWKHAKSELTVGTL
jgi:hypothetical protein